ncbi:hypothetical protein AB6802_08535 [Mesorhizobium sp. RCC_202]|uniref:hypothetical protein n=1 Tax=Mesorhizobium sp. RCC_202 TaxID=3239222 RepID=UPI003525D5F3
MTRQSAAYAATAALSLVGALLAFGQAVTLAWLSQFPAWQPELASLQFRFWMFLSIGLVGLVVGAWAVVRWVRWVNAGDRYDG